ncbi:MAG: methyltransferase domain-containing protein [Pyrinomonadaceae bacterium]
MFKTRSLKLERIDTGDYTGDEYDHFLREIKFINRFTGDLRALRKTLFRDIKHEGLAKFSVLDVGAGSGEMLRAIAEFAGRTGRKSQLAGLELNERSAKAILEDSSNFQGLTSVRGNALALPFADDAFDYAICSLFTHHLSDEDIVKVISEMDRVACRAIFVTDLHRHPMAYVFYKVFCFAFRISPLVTEDGSLSILKSFKPEELKKFGKAAGLKNASVYRSFPFRLILR